MSFVVIIPARFSSSRFPGKPLATIQGKPMIVRVMKIALMSHAEQVIIATDHIGILNIIKKEKTLAEVILTSTDHQSGTERLEEVVKKYQFSDNQIIINLQCDEPLISSDMLNQVANNLLTMNDISVSTLAARIVSLEELYNSNVVKVVVNIKNHALYFSRSLIPWCKNYSLFVNENQYVDNIFLRHIGVYAYRVSFIHRYVNWKITSLEKIESLEQLRILWYGEKIYVSVINNNGIYINVDTPEELNQVNEFLEK
ncbi:3-deoxy-manno-octulosonate cytidylyltransferase [Blochmannia endosymbiont of Polyrhachis (Hedomyrma) turneri]|uniref:3-deoxy-manno-octulosonate cytidylyltransferase n=1 Tax=Blochmannia endosymbiont of Polyrhachis (Hedomyrma) turneri TaxID=1505596 RepID=UPI00061A5B14|nr:3-deoxy-manno-octulosonate cytidylyltransferase [Blochmannia endosymbiont of Polyrhachis (Hedomyrma) turneri]AKC59942.1 3-deoxy-manno-octulosonate cytidylyltransferase [Blochmannia endosymbiont of Polyrhachis (Hedomyrma) turneri]